MTRSPFKNYFLALIIATVGILSTCYLSFELDNRLKQQDLFKLNNISKQIAMRLQEAIDVSVSDLQALQAFYSANQNQISKQSFEKYIHIIKIEERPYIQALSWVPFISATDRELFESKIKKELPGFKITQLNEDAEPVTSPAKPNYTPVTYFSSFEKNKAAQGFDLSSNPIRNAAIEYARDYNVMTTTSKIRLVQEVDDSYGFLIISPVYKFNASINNVNERRQNILGYATGVFIINSLMENALNLAQDENLTLTLKDKKNSYLLFGENNSPVFASTTIVVPNNNWELAISLQAGVLKNIEFPIIVYGTLVCGIVISLLLAFCVYALHASILKAQYINKLHDKLQINNSKLESVVAKRTLQLEQTNNQLNDHVEELTLQRKALSKLMVEAKAAQTIAESRSKELIHLNKELDEFAYVASHDLQAPLRGIDQLANWIAEDIAEGNFSEVTENTQLMRSRVQRLESLLSDLLTYSRANRKQQQLKKINSYDLIQDYFSILTPPNEFTLSVEKNLPTFITAHVPFEQVIRNFLNNAIKHNDKPNGSIYVSAKEIGQFYMFSFKDNGPGINQDYHSDIFKMFKTLRPRDEIEGSGMGLALIKKIVEYYSGEVTLNSVPGKGSTFHFTWPKEIK